MSNGNLGWWSLQGKFIHKETAHLDYTDTCKVEELNQLLFRQMFGIKVW